LPDSRREMPFAVGLLAFAAAVYCLGYSGAKHSAFAPLGWPWLSKLSFTYLNAIGAVLLIVTAQTCTPIRSLLAARAGAWLGRISFPLYLLHVPVLCSVGCWTFLALSSRVPDPAPHFGAIAVTILASVALAVPLAAFNDWWVRSLNQQAQRLQRPTYQPAFAPAGSSPAQGAPAGRDDVPAA
jgi:peptidoglycan/LPS O-acetylase OafA/YrhL